MQAHPGQPPPGLRRIGPSFLCGAGLITRRHANSSAGLGERAGAFDWGNLAKTATFLASFPPIQSAIKIGQDGMRIQLDVPETEMGNAIELLAMRDKVLRVTIMIEPDSRRKSGKRQSNDTE